MRSNICWRPTESKHKTLPTPMSSKPQRAAHPRPEPIQPTHAAIALQSSVSLNMTACTFICRLPALTCPLNRPSASVWLSQACMRYAHIENSTCMYDKSYMYLAHTCLPCLGPRGPSRHVPGSMPLNPGRSPRKPLTQTFLWKAETFTGTPQRALGYGKL